MEMHMAKNSKLDKLTCIRWIKKMSDKIGVWHQVKKLTQIKLVLYSPKMFPEALSWNCVKFPTSEKHIILENILEYVLEQLSSELSNYHLSFAGRVTLAKSIMEVVLVYPFMTNLMPKVCIGKIHKMKRNFIWGTQNKKVSNMP